MNTIPIFYRENVIKRKSFAETTQGNEEEICPICEDKKVSIMLDCYVGNYFEINLYNIILAFLL
jgi:hypothetical protein